MEDTFLDAHRNAAEARRGLRTMWSDVIGDFQDPYWAVFHGVVGISDDLCECLWINGVVVAVSELAVSAIRIQSPRSAASPGRQGEPFPDTQSWNLRVALKGLLDQ